MRKILFVFLVSLLFISCDWFKVDAVEYLDYYTNSSAIDNHTLDGDYPSYNDVVHIPSGADRTVHFLLRNPKDYDIDFVLEWEGTPMGSVDPILGTDYYFVKNGKHLVDLVFTDSFLSAMDEHVDYGDISAKVRLSESITGREFETYSYSLIANSPPSKPDDVVLVKNIFEDEWVLSVNLPSEKIDRDIRKVRINGVEYSVDIDADTGDLSIIEDGGILTKNRPIVDESYVMTNYNGSIVFNHSQNRSLYLPTGYVLDENPAYTVEYIDSRGVPSGMLTINTQGVVQTDYFVIPDSEKASDEGIGLYDLPFETVERAIEIIKLKNDPVTQYTIHIGGEITKPITIEGNVNINIIGTGENGATINANNAGRVLHIKGANVILGSNLTLTGGMTAIGAGVYVESGSLTLSGATIENNHSSYRGGGVYVNVGASMSMSDGIIQDNTATNAGGGVFVVEGATLKVSGKPTIIGNTKGTESNAPENNVQYTNSLTESAIHITGKMIGGSIGLTPSFSEQKAILVMVEDGIEYDVAYFDIDNDSNLDLNISDSNELLIAVSTVYISNVGKGTQDGYTYENAMGVNTQAQFDAVKEKLTIGKGTMWVIDTLVVTDGGIWDGGDFDEIHGNDIMLKRYNGHAGGNSNTSSLIQVNTGILILQDITIDGQGNVNSLGGIAGATDALVKVGSGAVLTLNNGSILQNNKNAYNSDSDFENAGGAINISGGTVLLPENTTAQIKSNQAEHGGAICIVSGTLTMNDGMLGGETAADKNTATTNAAVYVGNGAVFTMTSGDIKNNEAEGDTGGGVYVITGGKFTMSGDAKISKNSASHSSSSKGKGGGVSIEGGTFEMNGGEISGNTAAYRAGGVFYDSGDFTMTGGSIIHNIAKYTDGGGVYVANDAIFKLKGNPTITDNGVKGSFDKDGYWIEGDDGYRSNVYIAGYKEYITLIGELTGKKESIGISHDDYEVPIVQGSAQFPITDSNKNIFIDDTDDMVFIAKDNNLVGDYPKRTLYVNSSAGSDGDGTSQKPFNNVQAAVDKIIEDAGGEIDETRYTIDISGRFTDSGSSDLGMIVIDSDAYININLYGNPANPAIIDAGTTVTADSSGNVTISEASSPKRVLYVYSKYPSGGETSEITLSGNLTLTGGYAKHTGNLSNAYGGGLYVRCNTLNITDDVIISGNVVRGRDGDTGANGTASSPNGEPGEAGGSVYGGGLCVESTSNVFISGNVKISDNVAWAGKAGQGGDGYKGADASSSGNGGFAGLLGSAAGGGMYITSISTGLHISENVEILGNYAIGGDGNIPGLSPSLTSESDNSMYRYPGTASGGGAYISCYGDRQVVIDGDNIQIKNNYAIAGKPGDKNDNSDNGKLNIAQGFSTEDRFVSGGGLFLYLSGAALTMSGNVYIDSNSVIGSNGGNGGDANSSGTAGKAGNGVGARGGGLSILLYSSSDGGNATIGNGVKIRYNNTTAGNGGVGGSGGTGTVGGNGGNVYGSGFYVYRELETSFNSAAQYSLNTYEFGDGGMGGSSNGAQKARGDGGTYNDGYNTDSLYEVVE